MGETDSRRFFFRRLQQTGRDFFGRIFPTLFLENLIAGHLLRRKHQPPVIVYLLEPRKENSYFPYTGCLKVSLTMAMHNAHINIHG